MAMAIAETEIRAWKPAVAGIREVLHARFTDHAYPPHTHDTWTLFIVDDGAIRYGLDRHERDAEPAMVSFLPPFVVHDGRPASRHGFRKRVVYLEPDVLGEELIGPAVDLPALTDPDLRRSVSSLHDALRCPDDRLEAEIRLTDIVERIRACLGHPNQDADGGPRPDLAGRLRELIDSRVSEPITMAEAAVELDAGPTQLARGFRAAFGIAPHQYLMARRLDAARERILAGQPLADVAAELGFCDQAHLTRRFRQFLGTTPGRFAGRRAEA